MKPIVVLFCFMFAVITEAKGNSFFVMTNPDDQIAELLNIFQEIEDSLPPKFNEELEFAPVSFRSLDNKNFATDGSCPTENLRIGAENFYVSKLFRTVHFGLFVHSDFLEAFTGRLRVSFQNCFQYKTLEKTFSALLVHETSHLLDDMTFLRTDRHISADPVFLAIEEFPQAEGRSLVSESFGVVPNTLARASAIESFAIYSEHYVLDKRFVCRRPRLQNWYLDKLGQPPKNGDECSSYSLPIQNQHQQMQLQVGRNELKNAWLEGDSDLPSAIILELKNGLIRWELEKISKPNGLSFHGWISRKVVEKDLKARPVRLSSQQKQNLLATISERAWMSHYPLGTNLNQVWKMFWTSVYDEDRTEPVLEHESFIKNQTNFSYHLFKKSTPSSYGVGD